MEKNEIPVVTGYWTGIAKVRVAKVRVALSLTLRQQAGTLTSCWARQTPLMCRRPEQTFP